MEQIKTIQRSHSVEVNMYKQGLSSSHVYMNSEATNVCTAKFHIFKKMTQII